MSPDNFASDDTLVAEATERIVLHVTQMPFRGMVNVEHEPSMTDDLVGFICNMADWIANYRAVIARQSDDFTRTSAKLRQLEDQRDTIRKFFGTAEDI